MKLYRITYYSLTSFLILVILSYHCLDIISYFEKLYKIDRIDPEKYPVYAIYDIRMSHVWLWYRLIYFSSLAIIVLFSLHAYRNAAKNEVSKKYTLALVVVPLIYFITVLLFGFFGSLSVI